MLILINKKTMNVSNTLLIPLKGAVGILLAMVILSTSLLAQEAPRVAVLDFQTNEETGISDLDARAMTSQFRDELQASGAFRLVEVSEIEAVFENQARSVSDFYDPDSAKALGKLLAADQLMIGDIEKLGNQLLISVRIIDGTTGVREDSKSERFNFNGEEREKSALFDVSIKLAQRIAGTYEPKKKRGWLIVAGAAVLGGAAAGYFLLFNDGGGNGSLPMPPSPPSN